MSDIKKLIICTHSSFPTMNFMPQLYQLLIPQYFVAFPSAFPGKGQKNPTTGLLLRGQWQIPDCPLRQPSSGHKPQNVSRNRSHGNGRAPVGVPLLISCVKPAQSSKEKRMRAAPMGESKEQRGQA